MRRSLHVLLASLLYAGCKPEVPQPPTTPPASGAIVAVDDLMRNPEKFTGALKVEGVVSEISEKDKTLGLIDVREFRACGGIECAELVLPVRWSGPMPAPSDAVHVEGRVVESGGKSMFEATAVSKVTLPEEGAK